MSEAANSILVVDDSLTVRMDLAEAFQASGFETMPCGTLAEARAALAEKPAALIVLDVLLPDGTLLNTAWVSKFGFPVATVRVTFSKK